MAPFALVEELVGEDGHAVLALERGLEGLESFGGFLVRLSALGDFNAGKVSVSMFSEMRRASACSAFLVLLHQEHPNGSSVQTDS